jgi:hypothetical protein
MSIAAVALCTPQPARAEIVTATITGKITSGTDITGVFGKPGPLAGDTYTAIFYINSSKGGPYPNPPSECDNGLTDPNNSGADSPVVQVVLTINTPEPHTHTLYPTKADYVDAVVTTGMATSPKLGIVFDLSDKFSDNTQDNIGTELFLCGIPSADECCKWWSDFSYTLNPAAGDTYTGSSGFQLSEIVNGVPTLAATAFFSITSVVVTPHRK